MISQKYTIIPHPDILCLRSLATGQLMEDPYAFGWTCQMIPHQKTKPQNPKWILR